MQSRAKRREALKTGPKERLTQNLTFTVRMGRRGVGQAASARLGSSHARAPGWGRIRHVREIKWKLEWLQQRERGGEGPQVCWRRKVRARPCRAQKEHGFSSKCHGKPLTFFSEGVTCD